MLRALIAKAVIGEKSETCELQIPRTGQSPVVVHLTAALVTRTKYTLLIAAEDITEHKARAEQLARTEAALREEHRRKDEFLAMLSHELRNPLAPIRNSLYVLNQMDPGDVPGPLGPRG